MHGQYKTNHQFVILLRSPNFSDYQIFILLISGLAKDFFLLPLHLIKRFIFSLLCLQPKTELDN